MMKGTRFRITTRVQYVVPSQGFTRGIGKEVGHKHNYCFICSPTDTTKVQPTKLCPKYIWVDVIARFVFVLSRQSGVVIFGNQPKEVLWVQESLTLAKHYALHSPRFLQEYSRDA